MLRYFFCFLGSKLNNVHEDSGFLVEEPLNYLLQICVNVFIICIKEADWEQK